MRRAASILLLAACAPVEVEAPDEDQGTVADPSPRDLVAGERARDLVSLEDLASVEEPDLATWPDLAPDPCGGPPDLPRLARRIDAAVAAAGLCGDVGWSVSDLLGSRIESNAGAPHESASTIKLFVMVAVLDDVEHGRDSLGAMMSCNGVMRTVDACLGLMIGVSDNCATYDLVKRTGIAHVGEITKNVFGLKESALHRWCPSWCPGYANPCPNSDGSGKGNTLTAHEVTLALERLHEGKVLPTQTGKAWAHLKAVTSTPKLLDRLVPVPVGHKPGWLPAALDYQPLVRNDAGVIFACRPHAITVLVEHTWKKVAEDDAAIALVGEIGRLGFCTFEPKGTARDGVTCDATWMKPAGAACP